MKNVRVAMYDFALVPLKGSTPHGVKCTDFDDLDEARNFADGQKENWDRVSIFQRSIDDEWEKIEHYEKPIDRSGPARKYVGNKRVEE
ncbi:MAG: hypothetical protein WAW37_15505 [Syntrophobacteraceae bacterium]